MGTKHVTALAVARLAQAAKARPLSSANHAGANCGINAMPEASFTSGWYRTGRPLSQSERLPS
jgi:hypothetical protein